MLRWDCPIRTIARICVKGPWPGSWLPVAASRPWRSYTTTDHQIRDELRKDAHCASTTATGFDEASRRLKSRVIGAQDVDQIRGGSSHHNVASYVPSPTVEDKASRPASNARISRQKLRRMKYRLIFTAQTLESQYRSRKSISLWRRRFAGFSSMYDDRLKNTSRESPIVPTVDIRTFDWVDEILASRSPSRKTSALARMARQASVSTTFVWMQVAMWLAKYEPDCLMDFIRATHSETCVPILCLEDCLFHLARLFVRYEGAERIRKFRALADSFCVVAASKTRRHTRLRFYNSFIRHLIVYCDAETVNKIYRATKVRTINISANAYLHFASSFAKHGRFSQALDALLEAKDGGIDMQEENVKSVCATLLRQSASQPGGLRTCLRVVSNLVSMGLELNGPICDIIMLNAVEAGDVTTAFSVYRSLRERGLQPRESTFMVLFKGCKVNIDDVETLDATIRDAVINGQVRTSPLVATEILHCLSLRHARYNPGTVPRSITEAYTQLFDFGPLEKLQLPSLPPLRGQEMIQNVMSPTPHATGFVIGASIRYVAQRSDSLPGLTALYSRWRSLVEEGEPCIAIHATTDHVANMFLLGFIQHPSGLTDASRVIRDMQRPLPSSAGVQQCPPTVQTWSIYLAGFTRHGKLDFAEQLLKYMKIRNMEPNQVTWNSLVWGYARAQDAAGTIDALDRGEQAGVSWDDYTRKALNWLREPGAQREALTKAKLASSVDFTEDLRAELVQRLGAAPLENSSAGSVVDVADVAEKMGTEPSHRESLDSSNALRRTGLSGTAPLVDV